MLSFSFCSVMYGNGSVVSDTFPLYNTNTHIHTPPPPPHTILGCFLNFLSLLCLFLLFNFVYLLSNLFSTYFSLSLCVSVSLSVRLFVGLSVCLSVCLSSFSFFLGLSLLCVCLYFLYFSLSIFFISHLIQEKYFCLFLCVYILTLLFVFAGQSR